MKEIFSKQLHTKGLISIDYNKDSNDILSTGWDNRIKIFNIDKDDFLYNFSMKATIFDAKFLKNPFTIINPGKDIVSLDSNETISLLKIKRTKFSVSFKKENDLFDVSAFDEYGNIAVLDQNNNINYFSANNPKQILSFSCFDKRADRRVKIFIRQKKLIILYRENRESFLKIFNLEDSSLIFETDRCLNYNNLTFYKNYIAGSTEKGELDIWDIEKFEKILSFKEKEEICSILMDNSNLYLGLRSGTITELNIDNYSFNRYPVHDKRITALLIADNKLFSASESGVLKIHEIEEKENIDFDYNLAEEFINSYGINRSYIDFFNLKRIEKINSIFDKIENYNPKKEHVFKGLEKDIKSAKALILGQDPYPQDGVATGLAFEVGGLNSWLDSFKQSSLRNILRLLYLTYNNELKKVTEIRQDIKNETFKILSPNKLFKNWHENGVILLNSVLSCEIDKPASHESLWIDLIKELITFISLKNKDITYILWGKTAQDYEDIIFSNNIIKSNHPSRTNINNKDDFLNSNSFSALKNQINWLGVENDSQ